MLLRAARLDDAPAIAALATQLGYPSRPEETEARLRDVMERPDSAVLVAEEEGRAAGWLQVVGTHYIDSEPFALITGLVVDETLRSRGIGAALVETAVNWAARHGYGTIRVRSNVMRERAHAFYERLGFRRVKNQVVFVRSTASQD